MVPDLNALSGKERSTTFAKGRGEPAGSFTCPESVTSLICERAGNALRAHAINEMEMESLFDIELIVKRLKCEDF
jgi:hypothetical protein